MEQELHSVFLQFFEELPLSYEIINTGRGEDDFREAIIAYWASGERFVLKLADNSFTTPHRIRTWVRTIETYQSLGYYCPKILPSKAGDFPTVAYKGHTCVAYAEEFCKYTFAEDRCDSELSEPRPFDPKWAEDAWMMTAKVAAQRLDFCTFPSGYCLFEPFSPEEETDEVMENALEWKKYAESLPEIFRPQIRRIWDRWVENRKTLEDIYCKLPTSVFQADLNPSNLLIDEKGDFVGVSDFNLCGRDVFLNYLIREIHYHHEDQYLLDILKKVSSVYSFSPLEIEAAPLLYRCLKPLWFTENDTLIEAGKDEVAIQAQLDRTETLQTKELPFAQYMKPKRKENP